MTGQPSSKWAAVLTPKHVERFWSKVDKTPGCWIWVGSKGGHGYGSYETWSGRRDRTRYAAHRMALILEGANLSDHDVVRHSCDNPPCVNPAHLLIGTQSDNMRDAVERGRADLDGLTADCEKPCRGCGRRFVAPPAHHYCATCPTAAEQLRADRKICRGPGCTELKRERSLYCASCWVAAREATKRRTAAKLRERKALRRSA